MSRLIENGANLAIAVAALVIAGVVVTRDSRSSGGPSVPSAPQFVKDWSEVVRGGISEGDEAAPVTLVVFDDFECPFCRSFHKSARAVQSRFPRDVRLVVNHFPLTSHRFAMPAALAAECAGQQQKLMAFADVVYAKQDSLGLKSWASYAVDAGVNDSSAFAECVAASKSHPRVDQNLALGMRIGIQVTPTVMVNSWSLPVPPSEDILEALVKSVLSGEKMSKGVYDKAKASAAVR